MPPILKSGTTTAKAVPNGLEDRAKVIKITQHGSATRPVFKVWSLNGALLGAASSQAAAEKLRDNYSLEDLMRTPPSAAA
jgi:hypothetical protein